MKKCIGTSYDIDHCRVEKMGCPGCNYFKEGGICNEQKTSKCANCKNNKTNRGC